MKYTLLLLTYSAALILHVKKTLILQLKIAKFLILIVKMTLIAQIILNSIKKNIHFLYLFWNNFIPLPPELQKACQLPKKRTRVLHKKHEFAL